MEAAEKAMEKETEKEAEKETETIDIESQVMEKVLEVAKRLARDKKGALFVIAPRELVEGTYECQYPQVIFGGTLLSKGMDVVLEKLATLDGAIYLTQYGELLACGARVLKTSSMYGFGTRHAAAKGITEYSEKITAVLISEESGWIKVFQKGNIILETDAIAVSPSIMRKLASYLAKHDTAILVSAGISAATLGLGAIGVIVVGGTYLVVKSAFSTISSMLKPELK
jgi:DNA integrity scanning protein DisA with diadenylate cyclase activity